MKCIVFDIDGTLVESTGFDSDCFKSAVLEHADVSFKSDWSQYRHVTDSGILYEILELHDLINHAEELTERIKNSFIQNIESHISFNPVKEITGASKFVSFLSEMKDVSLAIATGGWSETALLKLRAANIDVNAIPLCSANDAHSRTDIMKAALAQVCSAEPSRVTYFGDASWDKKACEDLGWNFVLVGSRTTHSQSIEDFRNHDDIFMFI